MAVDELSQDFLRVLLENGGSANTTTIRSETGMTRGQVNHRFKKLEDIEWITIEREESGKGERTPPKVAVLTDEGDQAIRSGEAGSRVLEDNTDDEEEEINVSRDQIESFQDEIDSVKNRLNVVVEQINDDGTRTVQETSSEPNVDEERVERLEREVARLRETVELLNEAVSEENEDQSEEGESQESEVQIDREVVQRLRDQQEYLEEWMDVAQRHMIAMRIYMEENDEDFNKYLEEASERQ